MENLFKKAHKMTREIVDKYDDVDYKTQFNLCLDYIIEELNKRVERVTNEITSQLLKSYTSTKILRSNIIGTYYKNVKTFIKICWFNIKIHIKIQHGNSYTTIQRDFKLKEYTRIKEYIGVFTTLNIK